MILVLILIRCKVRNPDSARGPQQSGFPPLIHFVSQWTQRSLLACRELVSLSLPSLSPLATLRVAHVFPHVIHFLLTVLIKLTLCSSEVENNSLSQLHRIIQRDKIYEAILASPNFVLDLHNLFDDLPEPEAPSCHGDLSL